MVLPQWEIFSDCAGSVNGSLAAKGELRTLSRSEGLVRGWGGISGDQSKMIRQISSFLRYLLSSLFPFYITPKNKLALLEDMSEIVETIFRFLIFFNENLSEQDSSSFSP